MFGLIIIMALGAFFFWQYTGAESGTIEWAVAQICYVVCLVGFWAVWSIRGAGEKE